MDFSLQITDWVEPSFENFFGSSRRVSVQTSEATKRGAKKKDDSVETKSQGKKRANPFSSDQSNDQIKPSSSQVQNETWIDNYRPKLQVSVIQHRFLIDHCLK